MKQIYNGCNLEDCESCGIKHFVNVSILCKLCGGREKQKSMKINFNFFLNINVIFYYRNDGYKAC